MAGQVSWCHYCRIKAAGNYDLLRLAGSSILIGYEPDSLRSLSRFATPGRLLVGRTERSSPTLHVLLSLTLILFVASLLVKKMISKTKMPLSRVWEKGIQITSEDANS